MSKWRRILGQDEVHSANDFSLNTLARLRTFVQDEEGISTPQGAHWVSPHTPIRIPFPIRIAFF
ncbi:hypothetical protein BDV96DRAFT_580358 [Lophiotrema nucula]|uniref:Uncharacterized protein n=1 Tax=Lophiotrema nucula TaxID=690887 RepID=A0A6A5Z182_9PLEO|nr:hypothetical protein BDV96DRAFT_580358 [Lophiotrema nucula]